jgi:hypothetical protein
MMRILCFVTALVVTATLVSGCSTGSSPAGPLPPVAVGASNGFVNEGVTKCPRPRTKYSSGKASSVVVLKRTFIRLATSFTWTVTFSDQPSMKAPATYAPLITTCGPDHRKTPLGRIKDTTIMGLKSDCSNGVCIVKVTYQIGYTPKNRRIGKFWRYDLIRFAPKPAVKGYGPLPAFVVEVMGLPPG